MNNTKSLVVSPYAISSVLTEVKRMIRGGGATVESIVGSKFGHIAAEALFALESVGAVLVDKDTSQVSVSEEFWSCKTPEIYFLEM